MALSFFLYLFRYFLFAITVISDAIICSAAAWNLPIAKNANLHTQQQVDIYMIFLGALSLLLVIPMVFIDIFSHRAITGRVWVECLWIDFLWLLHLIGVIFVTAFLPHDMCTPQAKFIDGDSCTSAKLILAFSWICTINLFTYLVALVVSAVLHYKQDYTVWSSHVRSYPWYSHSLAHKLGNRPSSQPPRHQHQAPISAPQPRRPIQLPARAVLSFVHKVEQMHVPDQDPGDPAPDRRVSQPAMQQTTAPPARLTVLYPLHIQAVWGASATSPTSGGGGNSAALPPVSANSQMPLRSAPLPSAPLPPDGGPPPLWNWPRPDIMTLPPPARKKAIALPSAPEPTSPIDPPRPAAQRRGRGSARGPRPPASTPASPV
ncbi:hypothetical protein H4582DRAFT_1926513 [Lactarius indigo]|nr:hypothetical protein H4582DRAFT_1926513 [Lactarius indigo]